jgi:tetratricopeptide (TPR) repeat protein
MGDLLAEAGDHSQALPHYRRALEMYEKSAAADPRNLAVPLSVIRARGKLGAAHARLGNIELARKECRKAADLLQATVDDPINVEQRRVRALAYGDVAEAYAVLAADKRAPQHLTAEHWRAARDMYQRSLDIMQDLRDRGILGADEIPDLERVAGKIAECDKALGK